MSTIFPIKQFEQLRTPFYYYDTQLLQQTLHQMMTEANRDHRFRVHYAVKANANPQILQIISNHGLGVDCVSGGEIEAALRAGFPPEHIVYAGVGKTDQEITRALEVGIFCFNVESIPELEVINLLAEQHNRVAPVCLRINPDIDAHTHTLITTGLADNKFGISMEQMIVALNKVRQLSHIRFLGLHFHIGSQILRMDAFSALCQRINTILQKLSENGFNVAEINVGGGLGIDYEEPDRHPIPDFATYFRIFREELNLLDHQHLHFELGRSLVAQMGSLISRVLYIKNTENKQFAILDAGMTDLLRPALYDAHHAINNLSSPGPLDKYEVVGPICESSDIFGKNIVLPQLHRGDFVAIRSAGAYGEVMASQYNGRPLPQGYTSDQLAAI